MLASESPACFLLSAAVKNTFLFLSPNDSISPPAISALLIHHKRDVCPVAYSRIQCNYSFNWESPQLAVSGFPYTGEYQLASNRLVYVAAQRLSSRVLMCLDGQTGLDHFYRLQPISCGCRSNCNQAGTERRVPQLKCTWVPIYLSV